jgi:hypothetical protein
MAKRYYLIGDDGIGIIKFPKLIGNRVKNG